MEPILDFGIKINLALQSLGTGLRLPMELLSFLGVEQFFLLLIPAIYWCWNTTLGIRVGVLLMISASLNTDFKILFHQPRPYWYDPRVLGLAEETSFGIPSGHAQNAVVVWGAIAAWIKRPWAWVIAILLITLIGLSRLYLGVHFPSDVLAGWLFGAIILVIFLWLETPVKNWLTNQSLLIQILVASLASISLILLTYLCLFAIGDYTVPGVWMDNARSAFPESEPINPLSIASTFSTAGVLFGLSLGVIMTNRGGGFNPGGAWWKRLARFMLGIIGVLIIYLGLSLILPGGEDLLANIFRYIRYALVGLWVSWLAPVVFYKLRLAQSQN